MSAGEMEDDRALLLKLNVSLTCEIQVGGWC